MVQKFVSEVANRQKVSPEINRLYKTCGLQTKRFIDPFLRTFESFLLQPALPLMPEVPHALCSASTSPHIPAYLRFAGQPAWWLFGASHFQDRAEVF